MPAHRIGKAGLEQIVIGRCHGFHDVGEIITLFWREVMQSLNRKTRQQQDFIWPACPIRHDRNPVGVACHRPRAVFGLLFGKAEKSQLERIATLTGGRVFDARKGLRTAFKEIRGYQ